MKKIIMVILLASLLLLAACEEGDSPKSKTGGGADVDDSDDRGVMDKVKDKVTGKYVGFMDWREGMWAVWVYPGNMETRMELIDMDGNNAVFQTTTQVEGTQRVAQMWIDRDKNRATKYVMDMDGQIVCLDIDEIPDDSMPADAEEYPQDWPNLKYDTYTTPSGKTVDAAVYDMHGSEVWVSSEVPFGMVKVELQGTEGMYLKDFGTSGAKARISKSQAENCMSMEAMAQGMLDQMGAEYEAPAGASAEATYRGEAQDMDCEVCAQMPPAARNACMTSCS
ncbi:hypothetical protein ACFL0V_02480 [Nanoarchaeota archaeon]